MTTKKKPTKRASTPAAKAREARLQLKTEMHPKYGINTCPVCGGDSENRPYMCCACWVARTEREQDAYARGFGLRANHWAKMAERAKKPTKKHPARAPEAEAGYHPTPAEVQHALLGSMPMNGQTMVIMRGTPEAAFAEVTVRAPTLDGPRPVHQSVNIFGTLLTPSEARQVAEFLMRYL